MHTLGRWTDVEYLDNQIIEIEKIKPRSKVIARKKKSSKTREASGLSMTKTYEFLAPLPFK